MESFEYYWNFFVATESSSLESFLRTLLRTPTHPGWLVSLFLAFLILQPLEFLRPWRRNQPKLRPQLAIDVFYTVFNTRLLWVFFGSALLETWILMSNDALEHSFGITDLVVIRLDALPMWARFVAMYLFIDLLEYLKHWLTHRVNFLWEFHKVHHSSQQLDIWNANRFHFTEFLFGSYYAYFAMALVGFPTHEVFIGSLIMSLGNIYSHSNIRLPLGPLKYVINNPQLHIWHHAASVDPRRNVNYGGSLAVWDYLLGTAYLPAERSGLELGFEGDRDFPTGLMGQILHPFEAIARKGRGGITGWWTRSSPRRRTLSLAVPATLPLLLLAFPASRVESGSAEELALLGGLPALLSRETERAVVIGLGSGHTAAAALAGPWKRLEVIEAEGSGAEAARRLYGQRELPFPLDDPRASLVVADARRSLARAEAGSLDAVIAQPPQPWLAGSGELYTKEFFADVRRALRPGGVFAIRVGLVPMDEDRLRSVVGTLRDTFPAVAGFLADERSLILAASSAPFAWGDRAPARLGGNEAESSFLEAAGIDSIPALLARQELDSAAAEAFGRGADRIADEHLLTRPSKRAVVRPAHIDNALASQPWLSADSLRALAPEQIEAALLIRMERLPGRPKALVRVSVSPVALPRDTRLLVEGHLAAAFGRVEIALERYDASGDPRAARAADALRLAEDRAAEALRVAAARAALPSSAEPLLLAALRVGTPDAMHLAVDVGRRVGLEAERSLVEVVAALAGGRCLAARNAAPQLARPSPDLARAAHRCAVETGEGDPTGLARVEARARRSAAERDFELGAACRAGGNAEAALMYLRRALRAEPDHSRASVELAGLARQLAATDLRDEAGRTLAGALERSEEPGARAVLAQAARELGVEIDAPDLARKRPTGFPRRQ